MTRGTCGRVQRRLGRYVDGELSRGARRSVDTHLATCAACAETRASIEQVGDALRTVLPPPPGLDRDGHRAAIMSRFYAEQANSWTATFDEWWHDIGLRWAAASAVTATLTCALILATIAWMVPASPDGGFTRTPMLGASGRDIVLDVGPHAWAQRAENDAVPAVLTSSEAEEDLVLALVAVVTREGHLSGQEVVQANRTDREAVLRLMNAVQYVRFRPARDRQGRPVDQPVLWLFTQTTVRARFQRS